MTTQVTVSTIKTATDTQVRTSLNNQVIVQYAHDMHEGAEFPPVVVYENDDGERWLADGWHRVAAAKQLGWTEIQADIRRGTRRDALLHAVEANLTHGLRMTLADRKHAATVMLQDEEWRSWSSREIGRRCGLDGKTVERLRNGLSAEFPQMRQVQRGGKVYEQDTTNIGGGQAPDPQSELTEEPDPTWPTPTGTDLDPRIESTPKATYEVILISPWWHADGLRSLPVCDLAAPDCTLLVATTSARMAEVIDIVREWGFTCVDIWTGLVKPQKANAVLTNKEIHYVVAIRGEAPAKLGSPLTARACFPPEGIDDVLRLVINARCPGRKVELFAKTLHEGWTCMNEHFEELTLTTAA